MLDAAAFEMRNFGMKHIMSTANILHNQKQRKKESQVSSPPKKWAGWGQGLGPAGINPIWTAGIGVAYTVYTVIPLFRYSITDTSPKNSFVHS